MKRFLAIALTASFALVAGSALAASLPGGYTAGDAAGGIAGSRHNLGAFGIHTITGQTTQICVFCHTPHHTAGWAKPLWNRNIASNTSTFKAYGSTIAGNGVEDGAIGATSLACLSCHDGVTTFDNLVNRPGKDTASGDQGWSFIEVYPNNPGGGLVNNGPVSDYMTIARLNIGDGTGPGSPNSTATTGLSNDHPISITYDEGAASLRNKGTAISTIDLSSDLGGTIEAVMSNAWAVKGFINNSDADIQDLLREDKVECSSCHDPHFSNKSWDETEWSWASTDPLIYGSEDTDGLFLRRVGGNSGSGVCRTCHNK